MKRALKEQMEGKSLKKSRLKEEDVSNRTKRTKYVWIFGNGVIPATLVDGANIGLKLECVSRPY